jgi:hypothetical protein
VEGVLSAKKFAQYHPKNLNLLLYIPRIGVFEGKTVTFGFFMDIIIGGFIKGNS